MFAGYKMYESSKAVIWDTQTQESEVNEQSFEQYLLFLYFQFKDSILTARVKKELQYLDVLTMLE